MAAAVEISVSVTVMAARACGACASAGRASVSAADSQPPPRSRATGRDAFPALTQYLAEFRPSLERRARRILGSWQEAEDAVQEAAVAAYRARHTFDPTRAIAPWFWTIVRHNCGDRLKKKAQQPLVTSLHMRDMDSEKDLALAGISPAGYARVGRTRCSPLQQVSEEQPQIRRQRAGRGGSSSTSGGFEQTGYSSMGAGSGSGGAELDDFDGNMQEEYDMDSVRGQLAELIRYQGGRPEDVQIFFMVALDDIPPQEVAALFGLRSDNVRQRMCRMRKKLIELLALANPALVERYRNPASKAVQKMAADAEVTELPLAAEALQGL